MDRSGSSMPPCHVGSFLGARFDCHRSLLISLHTRQCMPLTELLERRMGLFLDLASMLFLGVKDQVAESY